MLNNAEISTAFFNELEKIAKSGKLITKAKKFLSKPEGAAAAIVGTGAVGAGFIDTRKKPSLEKVPKVEATWESVSKHVKPGDVIIGANRPPSFTSYGRDFSERFKKSRKEGGRFFESLKDARKAVPLPSVGAKVGDPVWSHAFIVGPGGKSIYGGGKGLMDITKDDIPSNSMALAKAKAEGKTPHYVVLRPKQGVSQLQGIKNPRQFEKIVEPVAGGGKDYRLGKTIWDQITEWITPQTNSKTQSFKKSKAVIEAEKAMVGGNCATTAAIFSNKAIAGKSSEDVLPHDFLYSKDYKPVAIVGDKPKVNPLTHAAFRIPEVAARSLAGGAAATAGYFGMKGIRALTKSKIIR